MSFSQILINKILYTSNSWKEMHFCRLWNLNKNMCLWKQIVMYTRCRVECVKRIYKWKVAVKSVLCWAMTLFYLKSSAKMITYSIWSLNITRCLYTYRPITDRRLRNDYFSCRFLNMIIYLYSRKFSIRTDFINIRHRPYIFQSFILRKHMSGNKKCIFLRFTKYS